MFPFFINSHIANENRQWPQDNMITWFYPTSIIPTQHFQMAPIQMFQNLHVKEEKPLPETQQDDIEEIKPTEVKAQLIQQEISENQIFIKNKNQKRKKAKHHKKKKDRIYYPNSQMNVSELAQQRFLKKNIEYNLLNQIFSYVWSPKKSHPMIFRYYKKSQDKARIFYEFFRILKRGIKRIINLNMLTKLCNFRDIHPGFKTISRKKELTSILSIQQFSSGVRFLVNVYLKQYCQLAVLTSKKMRKNILIQHLTKARELWDDLFIEVEGKGVSQVSQSFEQEEQDSLNISPS